MASAPVGPTVVPLRAGALERINRPDVALPTYDREGLSVGIVHFGVGGFHREHQAVYLDTLMNEGLAHDWASDDRAVPRSGSRSSATSTKPGSDWNARR